MTIYLYKKTHNITGLNYLGKTIQDPFKYKGSGKYWTNHIKKHGTNIRTEVLRECKNIDELKQWGLYYSELWDIVNARDEHGNKTWANMKPEEGQGWPSNIYNPKYDSTIYKWENINTGEIINLTQMEFIKQYNLSQPHISKLLAGKTARCGEWHLYGNPLNDNKGANNYQHDSKIYTWKHIVTGKIVYMDRYQFAREMGINIDSISNVINGGRNSVYKWKIVV